MRLARLCIILVVLLVSPRALFAAGGTCPSGANYLSFSNPTGSLVALSSFGVTSCYYIAANGSDSNNGTSESTPWLHAPGMPNCSSNCLTLQNAGPSAGTGFIFRGGDTWHFGNSSASPYTDGEWTWTWSGASGSDIYIGVDPSWYSGSSWSRPILNADNPTSASQVASCSYTIPGGGNSMVFLSSVNYVVFDDFEMTGLCWNTNGNENGNDNMYLGFAGTSASYIENNYIHGWTHTSAGTDTGGLALWGYGQSNGEIWRFNVIDGSDSDPLSMNAYQGDGYDLEYNVFANGLGGSLSFVDCHIQHDNLFENIQQGGGPSHADIDFCFGEASNGSSSPNLFYNNIFRNNGTSASPYFGYDFVIDTPSSQTDYVFNNVFHDFYGTNYNGMCDDGADMHCGPTVVWNNTGEGLLPGTGIVFQNALSGSYNITVTSVNNHWIVSGTGTSYSFGAPSVITESDAVYQTLSTANSQGYTSANDFSPTSSSGATVTASGANETTGYCADSVLHNAAAEAACVQGITGVSYNTTNHTVVYPAFPAASRSATGTWEVGAFEEDPPATVAPATNLQATPH